MEKINNITLLNDDILAEADLMKETTIPFIKELQVFHSTITTLKDKLTATDSLTNNIER